MTVCLAADAWLTFLPHGWWTVPVAVALALIVVGYLRFGPPALLRAGSMSAGLRLPESGWYNEKTLQEFVRAVGARTYRLQLKCDLGFLIVVGVGLAVVLDGTLGWSLRSPKQLMWLLALPGIAAVADVLEDVLLLVVTRGGEEPGTWSPSRRVALVAASASVAKLALDGAAVLLILVGCVALALEGPGSWPATGFTPLVLGSIAVVILHLLLTLRGRSEASSVLIRAAAAVGILLGARWYLSVVGRSWDGGASEVLGIDPSADALWAGLRWGGPPALAIVVALFVIWLLPAGRARLRDPRFARLDWRGVALRMFAILVGTVALEEILFRGLLFAAWGGESALAVAVAASSITFGLWHVGPAIRRERERVVPRADSASPSTPEKDRVKAAVFTTVFATAVAGVGFCLLRAWSDGIWAPALIHWTANSAGVVFSKLSSDER